MAKDGNDENPGTEEKPFSTLARAKEAVRIAKSTVAKPTIVFVRAGIYYQPKTFTLRPQDSGTARAPIAYNAYPGESVTLSGGQKLVCYWKLYRDDFQA